MGLALAGAIGRSDWDTRLGYPIDPPDRPIRLARPIPSFSKINLTATKRF